MAKYVPASISLNLPNTLTLFRILFIPLFIVLLLSEIPYGDWWAVAVFILIASSDGLDGYLARAKKQTTPLGQFLDPLADKLLISAALVVLVDLHRLSAWIAMIIIARELAVFSLRLLARSEQKALQSSLLGKTKTFFQVIAIATWILMTNISMFWFQVLAWILMSLAIVFTLSSGIDYFIKVKKLLNSESKRRLR